MYMLESEAKMKWCPMSRVLHINGVTERISVKVSGYATSYNRTRDGGAGLCLGSGCAVWDWKGNKKPQSGCDGWGRCGMLRN